MTIGSDDLDSRDPGWVGPLYLDASALVRIYLPEPGSDELDSALVGRRDLMISDLAITEIISALARRRDGSIAPQVAARLHRAVLSDVEMELYQLLDLLPDTHRLAERFLLAVDAVPLRAADALHLALASGARAASIVTYDVRMAQAALRLGLNAVPASA